MMKIGRHNSRLDTTSDLDALNAPLTIDEQKRSRFRPRLDNSIPAGMGPRWSPFISLFLNLLKTENTKQNVLRIFSDLSVFSHKSDKALRATFSELTTYCKKLIASNRYLPYGVDPVFLVNFEVGGGFAAEVEDTVEESISNWVTPKEFPDWYKKLFKRAIPKLFSLGWFNLNLVEKSEILPRAEFVADRSNWSTSGGSSDPTRLKAIIAGKLATLQKTKLSTALLLSDGDLLYIMMQHIKQYNKVVAKREFVKVRGAVSSDLSTYLKMCFADQFIDRLLSGSPDSLLFQNPASQFEMWSRWVKDSGWFFPFDQSSFDQNVALWMVLYWVEFFKQQATNQAMPSDILETLDELYYALDGGLIVYDRTGRQWVIRNGVMSGWKWTSKLDTLINATQLMCWLLFEKENFPNIHPPAILTSKSFFGDDIKITATNKECCQRFFNFMQNLGYGVNAKKVFLSSSVNEFLRKLIYKGKIIGYPARCLNSVLWRNPVSPEPPKGPLRAAEIVNSWCTILSRFSNHRVVEQNMIRDICGGTSMKKEEVVKWLSTPKSAGGLGYRIFNPKDPRFMVAPNFNSPLYQSCMSLLKNNKFSWFKVIPVKDTGDSVHYQSTLDGLNHTNNFWGVKLSPNPASLGTWDGYLTKVVYSPIPVAPVAFEKVKMRNFSSPCESAPIFKEDVPSFLRSDYLREVFKTQVKSYSDARSLSRRLLVDTFLSDSILSRGSLRIWRDWMLGELPVGTPIIPELDPMIISAYARNFIDHQLLSLFYRPRVNYERLVTTLCSVEAYLQQTLAARVPFYMGR